MFKVPSFQNISIHHFKKIQTKIFIPIKSAKKVSLKANAKLSDALKQKTKVIKEKEYVIKEKIREVQVKIDADCRVAPEAINLINEAAKEPVKK